ncbi:V-type ATP synthase subunit D, partial [Actinoallomurus acaciae]
REAAGAALQTAVRHAAAREAERRVAREIAVTRQRIRALRDRWIPRLITAIEHIDLALDEAERSDTARLLRAGSRRHPGDLRATGG